MKYKSLEGKKCHLVLINGYFYNGIVKNVTETDVYFLDRIQGLKSFHIEKIVSITELPIRIVGEQ